MDILSRIYSTQTLENRRIDKTSYYNSSYTSSIPIQLNNIKKDIEEFLKTGEDKTDDLIHDVEKVIEKQKTKTLDIERLSTILFQENYECVYNTIDTLEKIRSMIKQDIYQFLQSEDIMNYITDAYSPLFKPDFDKDAFIQEFKKIKADCDTLDSTEEEEFATKCTVANIVYQPFFNSTTRTFEDWLLDSKVLFNDLPVFNAALLYIAFELGLNKHNISPNNTNEKYLPQYLRTLANRALLYLARKGLLKGFIGSECEDVLNTERELASKGILVDEFFDAAYINSAFADIFPSCKKFNDLNVLQFIETENF